MYYKQDDRLCVCVQDDWWYPGEQAVYVHCVRNWTLGHPAFSHDLGQLSRAVKTPWCVALIDSELSISCATAGPNKKVEYMFVCRLLYAPFFCASDTGGNVYSSDFRFIESLPGPSQFSEPHPDDAERFCAFLSIFLASRHTKGYSRVLKPPWCWCR